MTSASRLAVWADLARIDLQGLAALRGPPTTHDLLARLIELSGRLPMGLIHASAVHVQAETPTDRAPLVPGSSWYDLQPALLVVVDSTRPDALEQLLADLADYASISLALSQAASSDPELLPAAGSTDLGPAAVRLIEGLQTSPERWQRLDADAPGLRDDLRVMVQMPWEATVHLHPHVRPGWLADAGRTWADSLRAACPSDQPWLLISDGPEIVELLSPYVRDLRSALGQWGLENIEQIRVPGWADAWTAGPDDDLATMVVPDLLRGAAELIDERRRNEVGQGMYVGDRLGTQAGYVEVERLAAPDRRAIPIGARGVALMAAGGPTAFRTAMVEHWMTTGAAGLAAVFRGGVFGAAPVIPEVVADDVDAFVLPGTSALTAEASSLEIPIVQSEILKIPGAREWSFARVLGQARRAQLCRDLDADMPIFAAFAPSEPDPATRTIEVQRASLDAARLVLRRAWLPPADRSSPGPHAAKNPKRTGRQRRFRA